MLDRIAERRAELAEQAEHLRKQLAEVEAELERVRSAEQVVAQLLTESDDQSSAQRASLSSQEAGSAAGSAAGSGSGGRAVLVVAHRGDGVEVADLPAEYQRLVQIVAEEAPAGQGVACKRVTVKLGLTTEPRHTEGVRVKLKRLVARGWLTEVTPGRFACLS
jgi:hypothetical protein